LQADLECATQFVAALLMLKSQSKLPLKFLSFGKVMAMRYLRLRWNLFLLLLSRCLMLVVARSQNIVDKSASPQGAAKVFAPLMFCLSSNFSYGIASEGQNELRATHF
jgi:hypothetical protein